MRTHFYTHDASYYMENSTRDSVSLYYYGTMTVRNRDANTQQERKKEEEAETIMKTSFASVVDGFYGDFNANILAEKKYFANLLYFIDKMICEKN